MAMTRVYLMVGVPRSRMESMMRVSMKRWTSWLKVSRTIWREQRAKRMKVSQCT